MSSCLESAIIPTFADESDGVALLDFKNRVIQDPLHIMASWNNSVHFCNWVGVTCSPSNGRVVILNLESQKLVGSIPPSIGNLTFLIRINLENNSFRREIPQEIGRLLRVQHLNLTLNSFGGKIPINLTHCAELRTLDLSHNGFVGQIPNHLSSLSKLEILKVYKNKSEYGMGGQVSIYGDIYSYGILLLEMLTGKRPTDDSFEDDFGISKLVDMALPGRVMDIVDRSMLFEEGNVHNNDRENREDYVEERVLMKNQDSQVRDIRIIEECLVSLMKIGLSCAARLPSERMTMSIVVNKLLDIKDTSLGLKS
ncbi:hypothetical protein CRYUN_Cryun16bG0138200 [Craigia yunnanensis]